MLHRSIRRLLPIAALIPVSLMAESVNITGKLINAGMPMVKATVTMKQANLSATTDEYGVYRIKGETTAITDQHKTVQAIAPKMVGSLLNFAIPTSRSIQIELFSLNGRKVGEIAKDLAAGTYSINPFGSTNVGTGLYLVRYSDGVSNCTFKAISDGTTAATPFVNQNSSSTAISAKAVSRATTETDTLLVKSKEGSEITNIPVKSFIDSLPPLFVVQRNIEGVFSAAASRGIGKITAILTEDGVATPKTMKLGYNKANNSYSGFVYSIYSETVKNYSVQVNVFAPDTLLSGKSVKVEFDSDIGNVTVPKFDPNNATPAITIYPAYLTSKEDTIVAAFGLSFLNVDSTMLPGKFVVEWSKGVDWASTVIYRDTVSFSKAINHDELFKLPNSVVPLWKSTDTVNVSVKALFVAPYTALSGSAKNSLSICYLPMPVADSLKILTTKDSLFGSWKFSSKDSTMVQGESIIRWLRNGVLLDSGKSAIAMTTLLTTADTITFEVTPVAKKSVLAKGVTRRISRTGVGRDVTLDEFLNNKSTYFTGYRYAFADTLGARGGVGNGGFRDSWGAETQIQFALPAKPFSSNGMQIKIPVQSTGS